MRKQKSGKTPRRGSFLLFKLGYHKGSVYSNKAWTITGLGLGQFQGDFLGEFLGAQDYSVSAEAEYPPLELGQVGKFEPGDHVVLGALGYLLAVMPLLLADVGGGPAGELGPDYLQLAGGEHAEAALQVGLQREGVGLFELLVGHLHAGDAGHLERADLAAVDQPADAVEVYAVEDQAVGVHQRLEGPAAAGRFVADLDGPALGYGPVENGDFLVLGGVVVAGDALDEDVLVDVFEVVEGTLGQQRLDLLQGRG